MSDFSAYTGWAIPEGNVVQVADASGRVLWENAPKSATVILRPSADIFIGNAGSANTYPSGSAFYQCVDEEVADGDSTYIYGGSYYDFRLTGTIPNGMRVTEAKAVFVVKYEDAASSVIINAALVDESTTEPGGNHPIIENSNSELWNDVCPDYTQIESDWSNEIFINAVNAFETGEISLATRCNVVGTSSSKSTQARLTQFYVELICEA